ncbi:hypothetical protein J6590_107033 [Homalodisca vitripennis]|nr:hypothetical protein J6590_107033 [Homalodisca vitripennis]
MDLDYLTCLQLCKYCANTQIHISYRCCQDIDTSGRTFIVSNTITPQSVRRVSALAKTWNTCSLHVHASVHSEKQCWDRGLPGTRLVLSPWKFSKSWGLSKEREPKTWKKTIESH